MAATVPAYWSSIEVNLDVIFRSTIGRPFCMPEVGFISPRGQSRSPPPPATAMAGAEFRRPNGCALLARAEGRSSRP